MNNVQQISQSELIALLAFVVCFVLLWTYSSQCEQFLNWLIGVPDKETIYRGNHRYRFTYYRKNSGEVEVKVDERPVNSRTQGIKNVHLLPGDLVCTSKPIESQSSAKAIARYWLNGYEQCLKDGNFPDDGAKVKV